MKGFFMDKRKFKVFLSYYKPYLGLFCADMFFATLSAGIALTIPLIVRYVTNTLIYLPAEVILEKIIMVAVILLVLIALDFFCKFFIFFRRLALDKTDKVLYND